MHPNDLKALLVAGCIHIYISNNLKLASKNSHSGHLATPRRPTHLNQGFYIDPFDYNGSISPSSHFFYPSYLVFYHTWLIFGRKVS